MLVGQLLMLFLPGESHPPLLRGSQGLGLKVSEEASRLFGVQMAP